MENLYSPLALFTIVLGESLTTKETMDGILDRVSRIRKNIFNEYGVKVPTVRIYDDKRLSPFEYSIEVNGVSVEKFTCMEKSVLIMDVGKTTKKMRGKKTREPAFKIEAQWIDCKREKEAEKNGYIIAGYERIISVHLGEIIERNLPTIITTQYVSDLLDELEEDNRALTDSIRYELNNDTLIKGLGGRGRINKVKKVLQSLLDYKVSIRNIVQILEAICDTNDNASLNQIVENVRKNIIGDIIGPYIVNNEFQFHMLSPSVCDYIKNPQNLLDPNFYEAFSKALSKKYTDCKICFFLLMPCTPSENSKLFNALYELLRKFPDILFLFCNELYMINRFFPSLKLDNTIIDFEIPKSIFDADVKKLTEKKSADYSEQAEKCDVLILNESENIAVGLQYDAGKMNAPELVIKSSEPDLLKSICKKAKIVEDRPVLANQLFERGTEGKPVTRDFFIPLVEIFSELRVESNFV